MTLLSEMVWGKAYNPRQPRAPKGSAGGGRWVSSGGAVKVNLSPSLDATLRAAMQAHDVSDEDLDGLRLVSDKPPKGWKVDAESGAFESPKSLYGGLNFDGKALYAGTHEAGVIRIAPGAKDSVNTFMHELGHHVSDRRPRTGKVFEHPHKRIAKMDEPELATYGLTWRSTWLKTEFMAEAFVAWKRGTAAQKRRLAKLLGVDDLRKAFYD